MKSMMIFLFTFLVVSSAAAQNTSGEIAGTVRDASGAVLPGVALTIVNRGNGQERKLSTDNAGNYSAPQLPVGDYAIRAELPSFKTQIREGIALRVGDRLRLDVLMDLGEITEQITVTESVPLLRAANAEVSEVITNQRLVDLPLNGRQMVQLALLSDNVFLTPVGTRGAALAQTGRQVVVGGQRAGHNMYWLDGVSITDQYFNNLVISPSVEGIQEFKIQKSIYSAEFGGKASANINAATKSGSNALHGSAYEFLRNNIFDVRNFFDRDTRNPTVRSSPPPLRQNQFGGTVGGPLRRDSRFFFANYEGFRERRALTRTFSVPSERVRQGDFSGLPAIYNPLSTDPATGRRLAFAQNRIPAGQMDPVAVEFLKKIPLPNQPERGETQNYLVSAPFRNDNDQITLRADQGLGPNDNLFGRLTYANLRTSQPYGNSNLSEILVPGFGYDITTRTHNATLNHSHIFSPSLIHEFRFGYLRVVGGQESENQGVDFAGQSGLQGVTRDAAKVGFPALNFSDFYSTMGDPATLITRRNNSFDLFSTLSWVRPGHNMKFGAYLFRLRFNPSNSPNTRGLFTFSPRFSSSAAGAADGNAFADFLLGFPSTGQSGIGRGETDGRTTWAHFYAQDDWQFRSGLTVNAGVRWEINTQLYEAQNRFSNIEVDRFVIASDENGTLHPDAATLLPLIPVPAVSSVDAGYERALQRPNYNRLAPRIGLAWSPRGSQATVLRAGFGLFYNQAGYSINEALAQNLPFYFNKTVDTSRDTGVPTLRTATMLLAPAPVGGSGLRYDYRSEYAESWTAGIQREVATNWAVLVTYFGSHIVGADNSTWANVPEPGPGDIVSRRPNPRLNGFREIHWGGWSKYHSLTLKLEKRLSRGLTFDTNYTWSKATDDASDPGATFHEFNIPQNVRDNRAEHALSSFDHRHRFVFTYSYELPLGAGKAVDPGGWAGKLLGGWSISGIGTFQKGAPITVNTPGDNANIGPGPAQRPDLLRNPNLPGGGTAERWFDIAAFAPPAAYTFGNAGRNLVVEAGEANLDFSLMKQVRFHETRRMEFRAEMFNMVNHTNFVGAPGRIAFTPNFGRLANAGPSRQMQFALKFTV